MSNAISINCEKRDANGSAEARRMRAAGTIPAVAYAHGEEAISLAIKEEELMKLAGHNGMVELKCSCGKSTLAVIKDVQRHPLSNKILHVDFLRVNADETIFVTVPVEVTGEPVGLSQGGQLEIVMHEIEIECKPANVPEVIIADASALALDQAMHVADLKLGEGVTTKVDAEAIVCHVRKPHSAEEAAPAEAAAPAADAKAAKK